MCLTGCLYAFKNQITDLSNRDKVYISPLSVKVKNPDLIQAELLKQNKELTSLLIPDDKGKSYVIGYRENQLDKSAYYNQYTGEILGQPEVSSGRFFEVVLDLHRNLMMGNAGRQIVGAAVLMFCVLLISGLILWLPKKLKFLKQGLTVMWKAKFQRVNHDLHNTLGFYTFLMLFFIAVTGLYVTYPWVKNALIVSLGGSSIDHISKEKDDEDDAFGGLLEDMLQKQDEKKNLKDAASASIARILKNSDQHLPYTAVTSIELPNKDNPRYVVIKTNTHNLLGMMLPDEVTFDKTGVFKTKELFSDKPLNKQFTSGKTSAYRGNYGAAKYHSIFSGLPYRMLFAGYRISDLVAQVQKNEVKTLLFCFSYLIFTILYSRFRLILYIYSPNHLYYGA